MAGDLLRLDYINSLPQPLSVRFCGSKYIWPVESIDVETGMLRICVVGNLQVAHIGEVAEFFDAVGVRHAADAFYSDYEPTP